MSRKKVRGRPSEAAPRKTKPGTGRVAPRKPPAGGSAVTARAKRGVTPRAKGAPAGAAAREAQARGILAALIREYPEPRCALEHRSAFELLVATILSAQCTDERVNLVTPGLFRRYPDPRSMSGADPATLEGLIRSTGFFRNKTKSLLGASARIVKEHAGSVPGTMEDLLTLPGVARKTANVVLGTWFGKNEGVVVDTHVQRLTRRMGLTRQSDPAKIEKDLMALFPREEWTNLSHRLIQHGRRICQARAPRCADCVLGPDLCPSYDPDSRAWRAGRRTLSENRWPR